VSILGAVFCIISSSAFRFPLSPLACLLAGLCCILQHLLDSLDGMRARRTAQCSNVGDLLDHSFDGLSYLCLALMAMAMIGMRRTSWIVVASLLSVIANLVAEWDTMHTHVLTISRFSMGEEGLYLLCGLAILSACGLPQ